MKHLLILVLLGLAGLAQAAPACLPKWPGDVRAGLTADGAWAYWWCSAAVYEWRAIPMAAITPALTHAAREYVAGRNPGFLVTPMVVAANHPSLAALRAAVEAAVAADKNRPPAEKASP